MSDNPDFEFPDYDDFESGGFEPDDLEFGGLQKLDKAGHYIIAIWENHLKELPPEEVDDFVDKLVIGGGLREFQDELEEIEAFYSPAKDILSMKDVRTKAMPSAIDALNYLEGIGGWQGFAGVTFINGDWYVWVGDTNGTTP